MFIKGFASGKGYTSTLKALPLARQIHNGQYREAIGEGMGERLPYLMHPLKVCSTLISLSLPLSDAEQDLMYACALLHDTLEDGTKFFPRDGAEYSEVYDLPQDTLRIIRLLSKKPGADEYDVNAYFNELKLNKLALMIKLADRSHNVEDLYTFSFKRMLNYTKETREYFLGRNSICAYAKAHYPELSNGITILKSKILSLTEATETVLVMHKREMAEKDREIEELQGKIKALRQDYEEPEEKFTQTSEWM